MDHKKKNKQKSTLLFGRIILFVLGIAYPLFAYTFTLTNPHAVEPIFIRLVIGAIFLLFFGLTFIHPIFRNNVLLLIYIVVFILSTHYFYLMYINNFILDYFLTILITIYVITLIIKNHVMLLLLYLYLLIGFSITVFMIEKMPYDKVMLICNLLSMLIIGYIAARYFLHLEKQMLQNKSRYEMLFNTSRDAIVISQYDQTSDSHHIVEANQVALELAGVSAAEITNVPVDGLFAYTHVQDSFSTIFKKQDHSRFEAIIESRTGNRIPIEVNSHQITIDHEQYVFSIIRDITERKNAEEKIKFLAFHDPLTKMPNRVLLQDRLEQEIKYAQRDFKSIGVLFLDLNKFKQINDKHGHEIGDHVLVESSRRIAHLLRKSDSIARYGGDEFIIVVPKISHETIIFEIAQKIYQAIIQPIEVAGLSLEISTSIGISIYPKHSDDIDTLIKFADIAMYHAKHDKSATYKVFDYTMLSTEEDRKNLS